MEQKLLSKFNAFLPWKKQHQEVMVNLTNFIKPYEEKFGSPCLVRFEPISPEAAKTRRLVISDYASDNQPAYYVLKMRLKLNQMMLSRLQSPNFGKITEDFDRYQNFCGLVAHTIEFGCFPFNQVNNTEINQHKLIRTTKSFPQFNALHEYVENPEFKTPDGKYYVRTKQSKLNDSGAQTRYYEKRMINWYITNWNEVSNEFDPEGKTNARYIELESKDLFFSHKTYGLQGSVPGYVSSRFIEDAFVVPAGFLKSHGVKNIEALMPDTLQQDNEKIK